MYCKAITNNGAPCIKLVKKGDKYCHLHKCCSGEYEECPICYDDMQRKVKLSCGHSFCISCLQNTDNDSCPLCRERTNHIYREREVGIQVLSYMMEFNSLESMPIEQKVKLAYDIFDGTTALHCYLFKVRDFMVQYEAKVQEFSTKMDTSRYAKQIASYKEKSEN